MYSIHCSTDKLERFLIVEAPLKYCIELISLGCLTSMLYSSFCEIYVSASCNVWNIFVARLLPLLMARYEAGDWYKLIFPT